jgi:protein SCO1/2
MIALFMALLLQTTYADSVVARIAIDQKLNEPLDGSISLRDETGRTVRLGDYFRDRPIILTPVYYACPMLCTELLNGLVRALRAMPLTAGKDFEILTFSIDPHETPALAAAKREGYLHDYNRPKAAAGWHFFTGSPDAIQKLTTEIGFRYTFDSNTNQWAHASTIIILTPDGRTSQYWNGVEFDSGDLKLSLVQASNGRIGSIVDRVLLYCYHYDPVSGKYSLTIMRVIRIAGLLTVLAIVAFIVTTSRYRQGSPPKLGGVAAPPRKSREATFEGADGVVPKTYLLRSEFRNHPTALRASPLLTQEGSPGSRRSPTAGGNE